MKISLRKREDGSVLAISMVSCVVIGIVLASFLVLIASRHEITARSMAWNSAMPVLEGGIEEALTHLKQNAGTPTKDGWKAAVVGGQNVHVKARTNSDGSYYSVVIYAAATKTPIIYSQGFTTAPRNKGYISRLVRVDVSTPPGIFVRGVTTLKSVTLVGNGVLIDGYDSKLGPYNVVTNRNAAGGIATAGTTAGAISIGNADVYGNAMTGPGGTVTMGSQGSLGDVAWVSSGKTGAQAGTIYDDFNASFPTNAPPTNYVAISQLPAGVTTLATGTWKMDTFSSNGSGDRLIVTTTNVVLWVNDMTLGGQGSIDILPGASLTLYIGRTATLGGGGIVNIAGGGTANQLSIIGLNTCTSISYKGGSSFVGTINAPQADLTVGGGPEFFGAAISKTFTANGCPAIHYDRSITSKAPPVVSSWKEL